MARLIDAEKTMNKLLYGDAYISEELAEYIKQVFDEQPTIEADPVKHGRWVVTHLPDVFQCDYCKKATKMDELCDSEILRAYCPNCGARMDGE